MRAFMEVNLYLRIYKEAFTSETVMNVLGSMLADLCQKVCIGRGGKGGGGEGERKRNKRAEVTGVR